MRLTLGVALSLGALAVPLATAAAQQTPANSNAPLASALRANLQRSQRVFVAAAEAMPADKYGYKPTPAQNSFAHLVQHAIMANDYMCGLISGTKAPARAKLSETSPKDSAVAQLRESYSFCSTALGTLDDANLGAQLPFFGGRTISRAGAEVDLSDDWTDHYATAAMYLRLNGILPPTARRAAQ